MSLAMKYGRHDAESAGIVEIPTVLEEDSGLSTVILRNQDNTVSRLSDNAAGNVTNLRMIPMHSSDELTFIDRPTLAGAFISRIRKQSRAGCA
jgi:hypothetical protein